jgi:hypothetical protein
MGCNRNRQDKHTVEKYHLNVMKIRPFFYLLDLFNTDSCKSSMFRFLFVLRVHLCNSKTYISYYLSYNLLIYITTLPHNNYSYDLSINLPFRKMNVLTVIQNFMRELTNRSTHNGFCYYCSEFSCFHTKRESEEGPEVVGRGTNLYHNLKKNGESREGCIVVNQRFLIICHAKKKCFFDTLQID